MTERKEAVRAEMDADKRDPFQAACCMGMDGLRLSMGLPPKSYSPQAIAAWFDFLARPLSEGNREAEG
jgi:hypothetical protein